ncbi:hypothetical protein [Serratia odorifera]|uniref:Uncharacterized protein n=2 Tax=Serratia odorifera TaxID=618 RepID=D4E3V3_SEROD|nr:hypothetical protein [Serratia odorifera]EFE95651.1 hypothetical protein HMPREF0758_2853 [Serratia odorifera DSM 4582]VDZ60550.1 Uncharacterised protein [Serratia odorifera]
MLYNDWPVDNYRYKKSITPKNAFANYWRDGYMHKLSGFGVYDINKIYLWEYK